MTAAPRRASTDLQAAPERLTAQQRLLRVVQRHRRATVIPAAVLTVVSLTAAFLPVDGDPLPAVDGAETVVVTGPVRLGRELAPAAAAYGHDWVWDTSREMFSSAAHVSVPWVHPFEPSDPVPLATALPGTVVRDGAHPDAAAAAAAAGVDTVAATSPLYAGQATVEDALAAFDSAGLATAGIGLGTDRALTPAVAEVGARTVATFGFVDRAGDAASGPVRAGVAAAWPARMIAAVRQASHHDLTIVHLYGGVTFDHRPQPRHQDLARALVDAGADVVVGTGAGVVHPVEIHRDGLIVYSPGNFVAGQGWTRTSEGVTVHITWEGSGERRVRLEPHAVKQGRPVAAHPLRAARIRGHLSASVSGAGPQPTWERTGQGGVTTLLPARQG